MIAFGGLSWALDGASAPVGAVSRLEPAMNAAGAVASGAAHTADLPRCEIRFRGVRFAYPGMDDAVLDGFDLQWQKLALARGFMRDEPLLLVLDEPTAALDAETEHALFEKYAAAARGDRITLLVSHRFSTVRMADQIVVLDGAKVAEVGTHQALIAKGGHYAELYGIQAAAYR